MEPDSVELRILGCLVEKQRTTPDAYPLSLNSLRLACNQSTNRDPVVDYDEATIREALHRLARRRWTRLAGASRAARYRHLLDEALGLAPDELALLSVLLLRGPQTPGELNQRAARLHPFSGTESIVDTLGRLAARGVVERLPRQPGQKEERYVQRLGADGAPVAAAGPAPEAPTAPPRPAPDAAGDADRSAASGDRIAALEREMAELRAQVAELRAELGIG